MIFVMIKQSSVSHLILLNQAYFPVISDCSFTSMKHRNMLLAIFSALAIRFRNWDFSPSAFSILVTDNANSDTWCSEANACTL